MSDLDQNSLQTEVLPDYTNIESNQKPSVLHSVKSVISMISLLIAIILLVNSCSTFSHEATVSPQELTEHDFYARASLASADELPASFLHSNPLTLAAMVVSNQSKYDWVEHAQIRIDAKNTSGHEINFDLKTEQIRITDANVVDNLGNLYQCNIYDFDVRGIFSPDEYEDIGKIYCLPRHFPPEIKHLDVHVELLNWGEYDFRIPLTLNYEELRISYDLDREDEYNYFTITARFNATIPQYVAIKYSDISVVDDKGNYYLPSYCEDRFFGDKDSLNDELFGGLAERYEGGLSLFCRFDQAIPYEVNSVTLIYTLRGHSISETFKTDTVD